FPRAGGAPIFLGADTTFHDRPDVAAAFGPHTVRAGFDVRVTGLPAGTYTLATYPHSSISGAFSQGAIATITVIPPASNPAMAIDGPPTGSSQVQPFRVGGWAVDRGAALGTGIDAIHVWAFNVATGAPSFVGVA